MACEILVGSNSAGCLLQQAGMPENKMLRVILLSGNALSRLSIADPDQQMQSQATSMYEASGL
jgi:hypothetical protein